MAGNGIVFITVIVACVFMQTIQVGIAYPADDFFFNDQPDVFKNLDEKKSSFNQDLKEYLEIMLNDSEMGPDEGSGMGSGSGFGSGSGDGSEETLALQSTSSANLTETEKIISTTILPQETSTVFDLATSTEVDEEISHKKETAELDQPSTTEAQVIEESTVFGNTDVTESTVQPTHLSSDKRNPYIEDETSLSSDKTDPETEETTSLSPDKTDPETEETTSFSSDKTDSYIEETTESADETSSFSKTDPVTDEQNATAMTELEISPTNNDIETSTASHNFTDVKQKQLKLLSIEV